MATSSIGSTGADYATITLWIDAIDGLGSLSAPEIGELQNEEHNAGSVLMTGGTISASATNQIILRPQTGAKFSGNPMRYGDGARILFDGSDEYFYINWNHVVVQDIAIKGTHTSLFSSLGRMWSAENLTHTLKNLFLEDNTSGYILDDRGAAAGVRENIYLARTGTNSASGVRMYYYGKTYLNCASIALNSPTGSTAWVRSYGTHTLINCAAWGYATDYSATGISGSSKNCATDKASGSSNCPTTDAEYEVVSGDFVSTTNGSHDLRVASGSTKLKDQGAASGGTTLDIIGQSISNTTRDIGPFEYQAAAGGLAANPLLGGGLAANPLGGFVL